MSVKGAWSDKKKRKEKKKNPSLYPIKGEIFVLEESSYFSDYCHEIVGCKYISFRCYEQERG